MNRLADLIKRVPVYVVDLPAAEARGDHAACDYAQAMRAWRREAAEAIAEAEDDTQPDAFERVAAASALMRAL
jgi:hypothetical protein